MQDIRNRGIVRFLRGLFAAFLAALLLGAFAVPDKAIFAGENGPGAEEDQGQEMAVPMADEGLADEEAQEQGFLAPMEADDPAAPPPVGGHGWLSHWPSFAPALVGAVRIDFTGTSASSNNNNVVDYIYWNPYTNMLYFLVYHDSNSIGNIIASLVVGPPGSVTAALIAGATPGRTFQMYGAHLPDGLPGTLLFTGTAAGNQAPQNISGDISFTYYIVTYAPGDYGDWAAYSLSGCAPGSATPAPPSYYANSTDPGFVFDRWDPVIQPTVTESVVYEAQWTARAPNTYSVVYNGNGGHTVDGAGYYTGAGAHAAGGQIQIDANSFIRPGYVFSGWNTGQDGSGSAYGPGPATMPAGGLVLYAQWDQAPYRVVYRGNGNTGGVVPPASGPHYMDDVVTVAPGIPARTGFSFEGWLYNGRVYFAGDVFTMPAGDVTLVAQWTRRSFGVTYDGNGNTGGTVPVDTARYRTGATVTVKAGEPVKTDVNLRFNESIHFRGWFYNGKYYFSGDTFEMPAGDVRLVAHWDIIISDPAPPEPQTDPTQQTGNQGTVNQGTGNPPTNQPGDPPTGPPTPPAGPPPADPPVDPPVAPDPELADIPTGPVPEAGPETAADPGPAKIADEPEPLSDYAKWALINLLLTVVTGVVMALLFLAYTARKREEDQEYKAGEENADGYGERGEKGSGRFGMRLLAVAATVVAIILFVLTEDMSLPMGMVDRWTVWHVVILAAAMALALFGRRRYEDEEAEAEFD